MAETAQKISAASAAAQRGREMVAAGHWSADEANAFYAWVSREVALGHLPNDPKMLGLLPEGEWKTASSNGDVRVGRVLSVGRFGIATEIVRPRRRGVGLRRSG